MGLRVKSMLGLEGGRERRCDRGSEGRKLDISWGFKV